MAAKQSIRLGKLLDSWMKDSWQQPGPIQSFLFFYSILSLCHKYFIKKTAAKVRNQELEKGGGGDEWNTNGQAITKVLPHLELNHNSFLFLPSLCTWQQKTHPLNISFQFNIMSVTHMRPQHCPMVTACHTLQVHVQEIQGRLLQRRQQAESTWHIVYMVSSRTSTPSHRFCKAFRLWQNKREIHILHFLYDNLKQMSLDCLTTTTTWEFEITYVIQSRKATIQY